MIPPPDRAPSAPRAPHGALRMRWEKEPPPVRLSSSSDGAMAANPPIGWTEMQREGEEMLPQLGGTAGPESSGTCA